LVPLEANLTIDVLDPPGFCIKNLKFPVGLGESRR
jgi:hypothetical protein